MLVGICNQCGLCCMDGRDRCINLEIMAIGTTRCRLYQERYNGMPIVLVSPDNIVTHVGICGKDSIYEDRAIIQKGIGKGCSLREIK